MEAPLFIVIHWGYFLSSSALILPMTNFVTMMLEFRELMVNFAPRPLKVYIQVEH